MDSSEGKEKLEAPEAIRSTEAPKMPKRFGFMKGRMTVPDDFDTMCQAEIEEMFYGNPDKFSDLDIADPASEGGSSPANPTDLPGKPVSEDRSE